MAKKSHKLEELLVETRYLRDVANNFEKLAKEYGEKCKEKMDELGIKQYDGKDVDAKLISLNKYDLQRIILSGRWSLNDLYKNDLLKIDAYKFENFAKNSGLTAAQLELFKSPESERLEIKPKPSISKKIEKIIKEMVNKYKKF
jgi:hypothetical protein